ncbi:hypothetical protein IFR04_001876 [Cadophora malorum]|uniref:Large ribosomal subunit protein mL67 n=1 Tax=Cadophora malorum TaxID=108018 RepID=A0A8H7WHE8_9HELO|nr:hypothetical protein IFR04_001876 [Cadophora malorum]
MKVPKLPAGEIARRAAQATESVEAAKIARAASIAAARASGIKKKQTPRPEHGQQIFVFNHLQKNHVVYSLTRAMNNNAALSQLPFNGKKSVPAALRKDLWHPFAHIKFPPGTGHIGLSAFQKLREYRKRHELEWGDDILLDAKGETRKLKDRAKAICDQKANSVADMAAVLNRLAVKEESLKPVPKAPKGESIGLAGEGEGVDVQILWGDLHDAEYAERWAGNVEHGLMPAPEVRKRKIWESRRKDPRALEVEEVQEQEMDEEQILSPGQAKRITDHSKREAQHALSDAEKAQSDLATAQSLNITVEQLAARRLAKLEQKQAAREAYEQRMAERAEKINSDPEWYEKVKREGESRRAEKNLLSQPKAKPD